MKPLPLFSGSAKRDLTNIWDRLAESSVEAADRFVRQVDADVELICDHPERGERDSRVGGFR